VLLDTALRLLSCCSSYKIDLSTLDSPRGDAFQEHNNSRAHRFTMTTSKMINIQPLTRVIVAAVLASTLSMLVDAYYDKSRAEDQVGFFLLKKQQQGSASTSSMERSLNNIFQAVPAQHESTTISSAGSVPASGGTTTTNNKRKKGKTLKKASPSPTSQPTPNSKTSKAKSTKQPTPEPSTMKPTPVPSMKPTTAMSMRATRSLFVLDFF
jgi:hypothetical protein